MNQFKRKFYVCLFVIIIPPCRTNKNANDSTFVKSLLISMLAACFDLKRIAIKIRGCLFGLEPF